MWLWLLLSFLFHSVFGVCLFFPSPFLAFFFLPFINFPTLERRERLRSSRTSASLLAKMPSFLDRVKSFDAAPKIEYDFLQRTSLGACVSLVSIALMVVLFFVEVANFFSPVRQHELRVDVSHGDTFKLTHIPSSTLLPNRHRRRRH